MRHFILILLAIIGWTRMAWGQTNISALEYWFDNYSNAVQQTLSTPAPSPFQFNEAIQTSGLSDGLHSFSIRFQDVNGKWSGAVSQFVYKYPQAGVANNQIMAYEYWLDDYITVVSTNITSAGTFVLNESFDMAAISNGLHRFSVRFKDTNGKWSVPQSQFFYKMDNPGVANNQVVAYQYWVDDQFSSAVDVDVTLGQTLNLLEDLDFTSLKAGVHQLNIRFRDTNGKWSSTVSEEFMKVGIALDDYLIAHYPFDGNANDKSDFLHHGSIVEATVVSDRFGNHEGALYFDGSNDHVIVPDVNHLDIEEGMAFTVSLWLKHDGSNRNEYFLSKYNGSPGSTGAYALGTGTYGDAYSWFYCVGQGGVENRGTIDLNTSSWHHFVAVYNPGESVTLYIDGQLDISNPIALNGSAINSLDLHIGCGANKAQYYQGSLDDIRLYNKALTSEEVNGLYHEVPTETRIIPLKDVKFYPNPVEDVLTIEGCENSTVELFEMSGKSILIKKVNQERVLIDLGGYSKGVYILRVIGNSGKHKVFKVIKE